MQTIADPRLAGFREIWNNRRIGSCAPSIYLYSCPVCGATVASDGFKRDDRPQHLAFHDEQKP